MGPCALPEFLLGFRQADIDAPLRRRRAGHQELQGDRCLASAGTAFQKVQPMSRKSAFQHIVQPGNAGAGAREQLIHGQRCRKGLTVRDNWKLRQDQNVPIREKFPIKGDWSRLEGEELPQGVSGPAMSRVGSLARSKKNSLLATT